MHELIHCVPILRDNYCWLIGNRHNNEVYIVDPGEASPVREYIKQLDLVVKGILLTHKHPDHVSGVDELKSQYGVETWGPAGPGYPDHDIEHILQGGEALDLAPQQRLRVVFTPGHTRNHLCFLMEGEGEPPRLFCGDTLFSAGCGRLLGGTAAQLKSSLDWIKTLPDETKIYCSHEYTRANLEFSKTAEPNNAKTIQHISALERLRAHNIPSLPTVLALEKQINPFLRCHSPEIKATLWRKFATTAKNELAIFSALRQWKDNF